MRQLSQWTETYLPAESLDILRELARSHAQQGGIVGQELLTLIHRGDIKAICEYDINVNSPLWEESELFHCRQAIAFFSKLEPMEIGYDKEEAALQTFMEAEEACKQTNERFRAWSRGDFQFHPSVERWLAIAQRKIAKVLGPVPSFGELGYRFGKGATTLTKKRMASVREKFRAGVSCSEELFPAARAVLGELPVLSEAWADAFAHEEEESWFSVPVVIHDGRLDFVPKNAKTYRSVVTEPVLNGLYQLALGDYITSRLSRSGLDLSDQTRNQRLARQGSLTNALATLDLSSASDTIAFELVYHLLPLDWASRLALGRSGHVTWEGNRIRLEKFSSMGNGFTFPLESLIFWALVLAVCEGEVDEVSVYGDDIILPSFYANDAVGLLTTCGFTVNEKKSYIDGPFRESCGADWYRGSPVRPYFQKEWVSPRTLFLLHNYYVRQGDAERAARVAGWIHPSLRIYGPDGYGDGHLIGDHPRKVKPSHVRKGYGGYVFDTFTLKGRKDIRPMGPADYVLPSYSIYRRSAEVLVDPASIHWDTIPMSVGSIVAEAQLQKLRKDLLKGSGSLKEVLPMSDHKLDDGSVTKACDMAMPDEAYKRISIYTF